MCCLPPPSETAGFPAVRQPTQTKPPFTVGQLRRAIPAHCFERSLVKSSAYLIVDLVVVALLYYVSTFIDRAPAVLAWGLLWPAYWWVRGRAVGRARPSSSPPAPATLAFEPSAALCRGDQLRCGRSRLPSYTITQVLAGRCLHGRLGEFGKLLWSGGCVCGRSTARVFVFRFVAVLARFLGAL